MTSMGEALLESEANPDKETTLHKCIACMHACMSDSIVCAGCVEDTALRHLLQVWDTACANSDRSIELLYNRL